VRFASWMGGDRDGNPNVTPEVTKQVVIMSRLRGAALVKEALIQLRQDISVSDQKATPELLALLPRAQGPEGTVMMMGGGGGEQEQLTHFRGRLVDKTSLAHQPYGLLFDHLLERTDATLAMLEQGQLSPPSAPRAAAAAAALSSPMSPAAAAAGGAPPPLLESQELIDILMVAYESLRSSGLGSVADGTLRDLIRQLRCFGLALLPLDCRNESVRHSEALDAITRYLGVGSYLEWDEETRLIWLLKELAEKRPLLPRWASGFSSPAYLSSPEAATAAQVGIRRLVRRAGLDVRAHGLRHAGDVRCHRRDPARVPGRLRDLDVAVRQRRARGQAAAGGGRGGPPHAGGAALRDAGRSLQRAGDHGEPVEHVVVQGRHRR
jgi:phosphoenolpyruvate carboxylase